jgi:N4-gp56 family major capsid protein
MAATYFGVNDASAVKLWRRKLARDVLAATFLGKYIGDSDDSLVQVIEDTGKGAGDRVTVTLRGQLVGDGVLGDATLENNEEALSFFSDNLLIDQLRHATRSAGKMSEQRVPWKNREESKNALRDWWANRLDTAFFNQVGGFTAQGDVRYTGNQAVLSPSAVLRPNGRLTDESITSADPMTLAQIDEAVEQAKNRTRDGVPVPMRPLMIDGDERWVMFLSPSQARAIRTNTNPGQWLDIQKAGLAGGEGKRSPIYSGALGLYNGVVLQETPRVPRGVHSTTGAPVNNVRRAVLCGAQAAAIGFGQGYSFNSFDWNEELFDYGNQLGVEAGMIFGLKKTRYNGVDFSTVVVSTYNSLA